MSKEKIIDIFKESGALLDGHFVTMQSTINAKSFERQYKTLNAKCVIPIASFIYFSHKDNFYMNDSINTPNDIYEALKDLNISTLIMKPNDKFIFGFKNHNNNLANSFWDEQIRKKTIVKERIPINLLTTKPNILKKKVNGYINTATKKEFSVVANEYE